MMAMYGPANIANPIIRLAKHFAVQTILTSALFPFPASCPGEAGCVSAGKTRGANATPLANARNSTKITAATIKIPSGRVK